MARHSAGILVYRLDRDKIEVLLVHPGGPYWRNRDLGAWSIPKGEHSDEEAPDVAARREFEEETGRLPTGKLFSLGEVRQRSGKIVAAFAAEDDFSVADLVSNRFEMEWPPRSKRMQSFPEVDRAEWFTLAQARKKILPGQRPFLDRIEALVAKSDRR
ncbi:NUDIX domain-containing protein [Rhizobium binxianense]